ncbi:mitochondrial intermembrane space import and assembly protein 40-B-like [Alosa pseudoharengus]|uniref:mitochondrial intermembrane space import and assembly protein 40-B-like n=1 Tax=Alosa pseudoharengus TaxID=34774 RepID=UPI003F8A7A50
MAMTPSVTEDGKDQGKTPSSAEPVVENDNDNNRGLTLATGEIDWACPCLGGMATGPCGAEFRAAFSCFHFSRAEVKGSDCMQPLRDMQACFRRFPHAYRDEQQQKEKAETHKPTQHNSVPHKPTQHNSVPHKPTQHNSVPHKPTQHNNVPHKPTQH